MKCRLLQLVVICAVVLSVSVATGAPYRNGIAFTTMMPLSAKSSKLDPFFGGALCGRWQYAKMALGLYFGKFTTGFDTELGYKEATATDMLLMFTVDAIYPIDREQGYSSLGPYVGAGLGMATENATATTETPNYKYTREITGSEFIVELIGGTTLEQIDLGAAMQFFPSSDNTTVALNLSLTVFLWK